MSDPTHQAAVSPVSFEQVRSFMERLQENICAAVEEIDGHARFKEDRWSHAGGGGGVTRVIEGGKVFEKGGVNTSAVEGVLPEVLAQKMNVPVSGFRATGVSIVLHPQSPMIPTVHANFRFFEREDGDAWFGGGADLTPFYLYEEDAIHFHSVFAGVCSRFDPGLYARLKTSCDHYFFLRHRGEGRGIGGIFFDYFRGDLVNHFAFVRSAGDAFLDAYLPIVRRRIHDPWGENERTWQHIRRARYAEFNLVYDRGTLFGLETGGRIESILMSLPPVVHWPYDFHPDPGSREALLLDVLRSPRQWITGDN